MMDGLIKKSLSNKVWLLVRLRVCTSDGQKGVRSFNPFPHIPRPDLLEYEALGCLNPGCPICNLPSFLVSQDVIDDWSLIQCLAKAQFKGYFFHLELGCGMGKVPQEVLCLGCLQWNFVFSMEVRHQRSKGGGLDNEMVSVLVVECLMLTWPFFRVKQDCLRRTTSFGMHRLACSSAPTATPSCGRTASSTALQQVSTLHPNRAGGMHTAHVETFLLRVLVESLLPG